MISILVYPNITFAKDLEKDSYVVVLRNIIKALNNVRNDIEWTILSPKFIRSLNMENTRQLSIQLPTYPNHMRQHFNAELLLNTLDWQNKEYDIVYSHLPEHTLQLKNLFYNMTNMTPEFIGYTHWTEFPEITNYKMTMLDVNILGLLEMIKCGINTQSQKNMILNSASKNFNMAVISKLDNIIEPQYLGWETPEFKKQELYEKTIVFNHRAHKYKRYDWFLKQMDELWRQRKDFKVWVPLAETKDREYISNDKYDRHGYFSKLSGCYLGVAAKQLYAGWSISATDGMSVGVPYLLSDDDYYHELAGESGIYFKDNFLEIINDLLNNETKRNEWSSKAIERFNTHTWDHAIKPFNDMINNVKLEPCNSTDSYVKIYKFVKQHGKVSKRNIMKYMGWGVRINFTGYRNRLRCDGIKTGRDYYEA